MSKRVSTNPPWERNALARYVWRLLLPCFATLCRDAELLDEGDGDEAEMRATWQGVDCICTGRSNR